MHVPTIVALVGGVGVTMLAFMLWLAWYVPDEPSYRPPAAPPSPESTRRNDP